MKEQFYNLLMIFKNYWKTILWAVVILILSSIPGNEVNKIHFINIPYFDKFVHFSMYLVLSFLFFFDMSKLSESKKLNLSNVSFVILVSISYGISMELLQKYLFIERSAELADFFANSLGSFTAIVVYWFFRKYLISK